MRTHLRKLIDRAVHQGVRRTAHDLWGHALFLREQLREQRLDRRWGVETRSRVSADRLDGQVADCGGYDYQGVHPTRMVQMIRALRMHVPCTATYTFCDIGAGKGRAMMLAAQWPWLRVVGIELAPSLVRAAQKNLQRYVAQRRPASPMSVSAANALEADLPDGPVVYFLYNPFGADVLEAFLDRLAPQTDKEPDLWVAYCNPVHAQVLARLPWLQPVESHAEWMLWRRVRQDAGAPAPVEG